MAKPKPEETAAAPRPAWLSYPDEHVHALAAMAMAAFNHGEDSLAVATKAHQAVVHVLEIHAEKKRAAENPAQE